MVLDVYLVFYVTQLLYNVLTIIIFYMAMVDWHKMFQLFLDTPRKINPHK